MLAIIAVSALGAVVDPETQVRCAELAFSRSVEERDQAAFAALVHPDARFTGAGVLRGKEAIVEGWSVFFVKDGPTVRWAPDRVEVLESGDLALSLGPYEIRSTGPEGEATMTGGRFMSVWQRQENGEWLVVFDGGTPATPIEASQVDAVAATARAACVGGEHVDPDRAD